MFIFKNSLSFIIIIIFLTVITDSFAQPESVEKEDLKKSLSFDNWPGKNSGIRNGINLSKERILALSNATEIKPKNEFFISQQENGEFFVQYRSKWQQTDSGFVEITISFLNSVIDAHEYLIDQFVSSTLPFYLKENTRDVPPDVGDVSFYKGRIFIRNNIIVKIHAEGKMISLVKDIAKEIDKLLLAQETVESDAMVKPRIIITSDNKKEIVKP